MGSAAGRAMAGVPTTYDHLPFFYSDLFDLGYEAVGLTDARLEVVAELEGRRYRQGFLYYLEKGRVRGVVCCGGSSGRSRRQGRSWRNRARSARQACGERLTGKGRTRLRRVAG